MTSRNNISFSGLEHETSLHQLESEMDSRLQKGDAVFIDAVAEGHFETNVGKHLHDAGHFFTAILFALFIVVLLIAIAVGTNVYRALYDANVDTDADRLSTSLIANTIRANDTIDSVMSSQGPEGPALVLVERVNDQVYHTRIYQSEGYIVEDYAIAGNAFNPSQAIQITQSDSFAFDYSNGLLTVWTDDGKVEVALRSARRAVR